MTRLKTYAVCLLAGLMLLTQIGVAQHYSVHVVAEQHAIQNDKDSDCDLCQLVMDFTHTLGAALVIFALGTIARQSAAATLRRWLLQITPSTYAARAPPALA